MESIKRNATSIWDLLPDDVVTMIAVKVVETWPLPVYDLRTMPGLNTAMKRACSRVAVANRINLENQYQNMVVWG